MRTYFSIESEFRRYFGDSCDFSWCDFRPKMDGQLINASLAILPLASADETRTSAWNEFHRVWTWLHDWAEYFDDEDVIQVVVGFSRDGRPLGQIFKGDLKAGQLSSLPEDFTRESLLRCGGHFRELFNWSAYPKIPG